MWSPSLLTLALASVCYAQQETVLGVYMFHRHGDRTPKSLPPTSLTDLGYAQVYGSGDYYRNRYVSSDASVGISGIETDAVKLSQIAVSAPSDNVLMSSALGFLQGLYPPVGAPLDADTLRNGTKVTAPMDGYQLIPVATVSTGAGSEDSAWLQDATDCGNAKTSSNNYFYSPEYDALLSSTTDFYQDLLPVVNLTFNSSYMTYKNAYTIFDLINVATIHNATITSDDILTPETFQRIGGLANTHEFNLAYNASSEIRGIAGMQLGAEILDFLNSTIAMEGKSKFGIQFGAYGSFQSFFGLANLTAADPLFYGIPDYASSMVFELFTTTDTSAGFPSEEDLSVRFFFHNGTANSSSTPVQYPLFGSGQQSVSWADFEKGMSRFAIGTTEQWCVACGNSTGSCAPYAREVSAAGGSSSGSGSSSSSSVGSGGISKAVAGVIGAIVTLGVILLVEGIIMLLGGLTVVRKKRLAAGRAVANGAKA